MNKIEFSAIQPGDKIMIGKSWGDRKSYPVEALEAPTPYTELSGLTMRLKIKTADGRTGYVYGQDRNDRRPLA